MEHGSGSSGSTAFEDNWIAREAESLIASRPSVGSVARPEWDVKWARFETRKRVIGGFLAARLRRQILEVCAEGAGRPNGRSLTGSAAPAGRGGLGSVEALEGK